MTSLLNRVVRLVNNWKDRNSGVNQQEQLNLAENRDESSSTASSRSELIDLAINSSPITTTTTTSNQIDETNNFYYAISEQQRGLITRNESNCVQNLEMNIQDNLTDISQSRQTNIRIFPRTSSRRSSRSRRSNTTSQIPLQINSFSTSSQPNVYDFFSNFKKRERNFLSAICAIFCISILSVSLVDTRWFFMQGGGCNLNYVGVAHFFAPGRLEYSVETSKISKNEILVYNFILPNGIVLKNCANREIIIIMRTVIAFIFLAIFSSCIGLMLDTFGFMKSGVKLIRRHAIFHILTVIFCLAINGFCFWISERMYYQQHETRLKNGKKVDVSFDISYYLIVIASGLSILATAFTLVRRYPSDEDEQIERLLEEYSGFEEPMHLERSLPANTLSITACPNNNIENNNLINSSRNHTVDTQRSPPAPPSTPPPPLHSNSTYQTITEPPPPYDPVIA
ncbi:unnamed protein product [Brachionus calyciflorus]|uniref:Transmembrane protein 127 transmembrane region domain-containing protein n=1 Tax=Brachionus calyciflorus TaxID=104777 RepID=A0A814G7Z6_9BILA|nr:unnamed protein product [Brachionus calyciflorus]